MVCIAINCYTQSIKHRKHSPLSEYAHLRGAAQYLSHLPTWHVRAIYCFARIPQPFWRAGDMFIVTPAFHLRARSRGQRLNTLARVRSAWVKGCACLCWYAAQGICIWFINRCIIINRNVVLFFFCFVRNCRAKGWSSFLNSIIMVYVRLCWYYFFFVWYCLF